MPIKTLSDNIRYPGATKIAGMLDKPFLVKWANKLGKNGIDVEEYVKTTARCGTCIHELIERHLVGTEIDIGKYTQEDISNAEKGYEKYLEWESQHIIEPIFCEKKFKSEKYKFVGVVDCYCKLDGKYTIIDYKTSKGIGAEQILQLSSYKPLLEENGYPVDKIIILNIPRNPDITFDSHNVFNEERELYWSIFQKLLDIYYMKHDLSWE